MQRPALNFSSSSRLLFSSPPPGEQPGFYKGVAGSQVTLSSLVNQSRAMLEEQARHLLTEAERQTMGYYVEEYRDGRIGVEQLVVALFELLNTHAKVRTAEAAAAAASCPDGPTEPAQGSFAVGWFCCGCEGSSWWSQCVVDLAGPWRVGSKLLCLCLLPASRWAAGRLWTFSRSAAVHFFKNTRTINQSPAISHSPRRC